MIRQGYFTGPVLGAFVDGRSLGDRCCCDVLCNGRGVPPKHADVTFMGRFGGRRDGCIWAQPHHSAWYSGGLDAPLSFCWVLDQSWQGAETSAASRALLEP